MEKTLSLLLILAALSTQGCTKDPIDIALPGNETDTPVNADDTAGSDIETDNDDDNVTNTTFAPRSPARPRTSPSSPTGPA